MTNLSNSSPKPHRKLLILHGLNNNLEAFFPLRDALEALGHPCVLITLPGHDEVRENGRNLEVAMDDFEKKMRPVVESGDYDVLAFSTGAIYLQLWLERSDAVLPHSQLLLSPALSIRRFSFVSFLLRILPSGLKVRSQMPAHARRRASLHLWEYATLLEAVRQWRRNFNVKTLLLVDPKDELVDATSLKKEFQEVEFVHRPTLRGLGFHHMLFHPLYHQDQEWQKFIEKIHLFFVT